jgi:hypothetical protein
MTAPINQQSHFNGEYKMKRFLISAASLIALTATAQADIICTRTGCWETGKKIWRNGGAYSGLEYKREGKDGQWRVAKPSGESTAGSSYAPRTGSDIRNPSLPSR